MHAAVNLEWVDCFNHRRLVQRIVNVPPAELEASYFQRVSCRSRPDSNPEISGKIGAIHLVRTAREGLPLNPIATRVLGAIQSLISFANEAFDTHAMCIP